MARASKRKPLTTRLSTGRKLAYLAIGIASFSGLSSLGRWSATHAFMINASESLPNWAFFVETGRDPARNDYVIFHPGKDPLTLKYFGASPKPFAKIALGVGGDWVTRAGTHVLVNGRHVADLKPFTSKGDALTPGPVGRIPQCCIFAGTGHKDGYDSRYAAVGFVCRDRIVGIGRAIL